MQFRLVERGLLNGVGIIIRAHYKAMADAAQVPIVGLVITPLPSQRLIRPKFSSAKALRRRVFCEQIQNITSAVFSASLSPHESIFSKFRHPELRGI